MSQVQEEAITVFEKALEAARARAKPALLELAAAYNAAVNKGHDVTELRRMMREDDVAQLNAILADANDPEVAKALRDLGLHLRSLEI